MMMAMTVEGHDGATTPPGNGPDAILAVGSQLMGPMEGEAMSQLGLAIFSSRVVRQLLGNWRAAISGDISELVPARELCETRAKAIHSVLDPRAANSKSAILILEVIHAAQANTRLPVTRRQRYAST